MADVWSKCREYYERVVPLDKKIMKTENVRRNLNFTVRGVITSNSIDKCHFLGFS